MTMTMSMMRMQRGRVSGGSLMTMMCSCVSGGKWMKMMTVIESFGHTSAAGKGVRPDLKMDLLGVHVDVASYRRMLTETKCTAYGDAVRAALAAPPIAGGGLKVPYADFNSVVHKLLHAASTVVLGRQHLHHCMTARRAENRLQGKFVLLYAPQVAELRW